MNIYKINRRGWVLVYMGIMMIRDTQVGTKFIQELCPEQDTYLVGISLFGRWRSN